MGLDQSSNLDLCWYILDSITLTSTPKRDSVHGASFPEPARADLWRLRRVVTFSLIGIRTEEWFEFTHREFVLEEA